MLTIHFQRGKDKKDVLSVIRADGSQTWQHQPRGIPEHDLTHYAVESVLGMRNSFYGLLTQGWDISRLTDKDVRQKLPAEALWTELVVGLIQTERLAEHDFAEADFTAELQRLKDQYNLTYDRAVSSAELSDIWKTFAAVYTRWINVPPGDRLSLDFVIPPSLVQRT